MLSISCTRPSAPCSEPVCRVRGGLVKLYSHPLSRRSRTPMADRVSAGLDLMHRLSKEYEAGFNITSGWTASTSPVQQQLALNKPFCRLLRFKRFSDNRRCSRAMKKHRRCWWWRRCRATTRRCCATPCARAAARPQGLHHRLDRRRMVPRRGGPLPPRRLRDLRAGVHPPHRPEVNVISVCQPTVPVLAAISLLASNGEFTPRTMTMMGGPIDAPRARPR